MNLSCTTSGVLVPVKNLGKENKLIPWSMIKKETIVPSIRRCTNEKHGVDLYIVDKTVDGLRFTDVFDTKREAFKAVDIFLIQNGREPELILKRV